MTHQTITCTECGQPIHVRDGVAYAVDTERMMLHVCTYTTVPEWVRESVEFQAFDESRPRHLRIVVKG